MADYIGLKVLITRQIEITQQLQGQMQQLASSFEELKTQVQEWIDMDETGSEYTLEQDNDEDDDDAISIEMMIVPVNSPMD